MMSSTEGLGGTEANIEGIFALPSLGTLNMGPQRFGTLKVSPAEFWSNAICDLLSLGDIVTGA